jgi:hypothetical protein
VFGVHSEEICRAVDAAAPSDTSHVGAVLSDVRGNVLVLQPQEPKVGVTATLARWKRERCEPTSSVLKQCLAERVGIEVAGVYPLNRVWVTDNSSTFYFVGMVRSPEVMPAARNPEARWFDRDEAARVLQVSKNPTSRNRDLAVLGDSTGVMPSPFRRVLLVVSALHGMGFGRLRAAPWMHQNGYIDPPGRWSCSIVPTVVLDARHGALSDGDRMNELRTALGVTQHYDPWETLGLQPPFGWADLCFESPRSVAERFLAKFRDLCFMGWGSDEAYHRWFEEMLTATAPHGVFYPVVNQYEYVVAAYTRSDELRLPPPPLPGR